MLKGIEHVRGFLEGIPKRLELDSFWSQLESKDMAMANGHEQDPRLSRATRDINDKMLARADCEIRSLQTQIVKQRVRISR